LRSLWGFFAISAVTSLALLLSDQKL
jgi:hypothetical protein